MNKLKVFIMIVLVLILMLPVLSVYAEEEDAYDRSKSIPRLNSSELKIEKKDFFDWFGMKDVPDETVIERLVLVHRELENVDYSLYDLQCDFELKTLVEGEIKTSSWSYTIDFENYFLNNWLLDGKLDNYLDVDVNNEFEQHLTGDDYFVHEFSYGKIVEHAEGFQREEVDSGDYIYNTVISQADFYFVRKSDGEKGEARRFKFTWNSDFWKQLCTKIEFCWYRFPDDPEESEGIEVVIGAEVDTFGVDGYFKDSNSVFDNWFTKFLDYILFVPEILYVIIINIFTIATKFLELLKVIFPFIPSIVFDVFGVLIIFSFCVALWKIIKGE